MAKLYDGRRPAAVISTAPGPGFCIFDVPSIDTNFSLPGSMRQLCRRRGAVTGLSTSASTGYSPKLPLDILEELDNVIVVRHQTSHVRSGKARGHLATTSATACGSFLPYGDQYGVDGMGKPYRAGVIGLSGISTSRPERSHSPNRWFLPHSHVSAYHASPLTEIVAVCDVSDCAIDKFRTLWQSEVPAYSDFRDLLANEQIDILSIVTPDHLHAESFVAACEAGVKGIFCEKPISTTLEDADLMIAAAGTSGTKVVVNHTRRHDAYYRHARWLIDEGLIGSVQQIMGTMGGERAMLFRNGTHMMDTMLFFASHAPSWVMAVFDEVDANYGQSYKGDGGRDPSTEPSASAIIGFPNGERAFFNCSKRTVANFEIDVQCESGRIRIGNQIAEIVTESKIGGLATQPLPIQAEATSGMVHAIDELVAQIENDGDGVKALYEARTTLELLLAILISADRDGARIELDGAPS